MITEVSLKVLPVAPAQATLVFAMDEAQALEALNRWGGQPLPLNASCWAQGQLWLRLCGAQAAVQAACQNWAASACPDDQAAALWHSLREQQHPGLPPAAMPMRCGDCRCRKLPPLALPEVLPHR